MASFGAYIFSPRSDIKQLSLEIDGYLSEVSEQINKTRDGLVWELWLAGRPFDVDIRSTRHVLSEVEDYLLELSLMPDDRPLVLGVSSRLGHYVDADGMEELVRQLASISDGTATKIST